MRGEVYFAARGPMIHKFIPYSFNLFIAFPS
jgi:hypothetical protein